MPSCIILRGLPGSGKSTVASMIGGYHCSADDFFWTFGAYRFDKTKLHEAHDYCFNHFKTHVGYGNDVVVDNTNTTKREYRRYVDYAKEHGYSVTILTVETDLTDEELAKRNVHGVPVETIRRMRERIKSHV